MGVGMAMSTLLASCADDESFSRRGDVLSFSVDTLKMDTTFSNVLRLPKLLGLQPYGQGSALPVGASGKW